MAEGQSVCQNRALLPCRSLLYLIRLPACQHTNDTHISTPKSRVFFFPIVTGPQETEAARISCNHSPALNHNCVNLITSGVLSLHLGHKVAPRPHTFLLISGWRCVTEGVGSNNRVELLVFPWIPSGGQQTIAQELGGCGEVGNQVMQSQPGGPLSLSTNKPAPL